MPHESGWFIDDIELPIGPATDERAITRTFQSETLFNFFPSITKSQARAFDYTMTGFIYPERRAFDLDQIARSADTNTVIVTIPEDQRIFKTTKFAVKKLIMSRKGPLFVKWSADGLPPFQTVQAVPFVITLTELPDDGEVQETIDGFTDTDEDSVGLQQLNELIEEIDTTGLNEEEFGTIGLYQTFFGVVVGPLQV